ncbi:4Fe-4S binding protein, partial [Flavobacteriaceae bacterium]|nr:4Fe-4S binding protein [Flavobacteriaceae bacterium]
IGDCAQQTELSGQRKPIEAVWYMGRMMGETLAQTICGNKTAYKPGHWFNSAKFFEVEYQTYGWVNSDRRKPAHEQHFHWQHPSENIALSLAYHKDSQVLLAAYLGFVQRFKSRFRITTNGGQCISCGNCSTYCEMGIDVRAYAQKGENIVRSSCVGCGVCSAVCPRGVLKLEQGPEEGRINPTEILLGNDVSLIDLLHKK